MQPNPRFGYPEGTVHPKGDAHSYSPLRLKNLFGLMWRNIALALATDFTVVACDLRGYGDSSKPAGGSDHAAYSFRAMAGDW
ncbi:MAG: hypothetical protein WAL22_18920 [Solirubrobacteraceae bacterium]